MNQSSALLQRLPADRLALVTPEAPAASELLSTGIASLDAALRGGVPRGRITEITGPLGAGKTTLVWHLVATTIAGGTGVAYIDARCTLDPAGWASLNTSWLRMVRPSDPARAAWSADVLLRSGAFSLVVLDDPPPLSRETAMRLAALAREKAAALVILDETSRLRVGVNVRLEVRKRGGRWGSNRERHFHPSQTSVSDVNLQRGGARESIEVPHVVVVPNRLYAHPEVPDRRGVARRQGGQAARTEQRRWKGARNGGQVP